MAKPFTRAQQNIIAEQAAIIANEAFRQGRIAQAQLVKAYVTKAYCKDMISDDTCTHDACFLLKDIVAYINQEGKHAKTELGL